MLLVGILGFVPKTESLKDFLIFVACLWTFFNVARMARLPICILVVIVLTK